MRAAAGAAVCATLGLVTACGGQTKLTAAQTARWLEQHRVAPGIHVTCRSGSDGWDYDCTLTGRGLKGGPQANTFGYDVDDHAVTGFSG